MRCHTDRMTEDSKFQLTKGVSGLTIPRDTRYRRVRSGEDTLRGKELLWENLASGASGLTGVEPYSLTTL